MKSLLLFSALVIASASRAGEVEYRVGGAAFSKAWQHFYVDAGHEPAIDDSLIAAGPPMVSAICEAVAHPDMKRRRYAIGALGFIGDHRALPTLEAILKDRKEIDYFRGDALQSIFKIDRKLGTAYARQFRNDNDYLKMIATAIEKNDPWVTEPSSE